MDFKFVSQDGSSRKRRAPAACDYCKKRKKRCNHGAKDDSPPPKRSRVAEPGNRHQPGAAPGAAHGANEVTLSHASQGDRNAAQGHETSRPSQHTHASRFVGDTNPEVALRNDLDFSADRDNDDIGTFVELENGTGPPSHAGTAQSPDTSMHIQKPVHSSFSMPSQATQEALVDIFFTYVQPLLPVLHEDTFKRDFSAGALSSVLLQAVFLVASKHDQAKLIYRSSEQIYGGILAQLGTISDTIVLVQTLVLLSLHTEGPNGAEGASLHLALAIYHGQTVGLQIGRARDDVSIHLVQLFWCLWSLDRLNAAVNGRARLIHEADLARGLKDFIPHFAPSFRVWLRISDVLCKVINLYQPVAAPGVTGLEDGFPDLDEILDHCDAQGLMQPILNSLELYYHAVAILSCRFRHNIMVNVTTVSSMRRTVSAIQVASILPHVKPAELAPLPVIPWAISLAMLAAYQELRQSRQNLGRAIARDRLEVCQGALMNMRSTWSAARRMADAGQRVLRETDKSDGDRVAPTSSAPKPQLLDTGEASFGDSVVGLEADQHGGRLNTTASILTDAGSTRGHETRSTFLESADSSADMTDKLLSGDYDMAFDEGDAFAQMNALFVPVMEMNAFSDFDFGNPAPSADYIWPADG